MAVATSGRAPWALLSAFVACLLYASFASGATDLPAQSWVQLALALTTMAGVAAWLYGNGLHLRVSRAGLLGLLGLLAFAGWTVIGIAHSVAPDRSWAQANTVIAYGLACVIGLLVGSSLPRAAERVGVTIGAAVIPVALYALGGKTIPGVHIGSLIDFNQTRDVARLRAPLGYWNALALLCVTGLLPLLRTAADSHRRPWPRAAALVGTFILLIVLVLTYSRGGLIALVAGLLALLAFTTERVRTLILLASACVAAAPALTLALTQKALAAGFAARGDRERAAAYVLVATLLGAALLAAWAHAVARLEQGPRFSAQRGRAWGRPAAVAAAALLVAGIVAAGATGAAGRAVQAFKDTRQAPPQTTPGRLLSGNAGNRWVWWKEAAGAFSDRPVAGWGAGSFAVTHLLYRKQTLDVQQPHNVPLQWLAEDGLIGFGLALLAFAGLFTAAVQRVRAHPWRPAGAPPGRGAAAALLAIAVAWCAQALFEWSWDIPAITLPMFLVLGTLAARPVRGGPTALAARGPALAAATAVFVLFVISSALPAIARTQVDAALATAGEADPGRPALAAAASQAELAARLNPLATDGLRAAASIAARRGRRDLELRDLLRAVDRQPYDASAWLRLTKAEFDAGDRAAARRAALRTLALDPRSPGVLATARYVFTATFSPNESATAAGAPLPSAAPAPTPTPTPAPPPITPGPLPTPAAGGAPVPTFPAP